MIIDVVDLNLKRLDFNQSYDMGRYTKGMHIYSLGRVKVNKVEINDENTYEIEADVDGNYDNYTTTLTIKGNMIKACTCTCADYQKGNLCKHIIATAREVLDPHCASTEKRRKEIEKQRIEEEKKRLEEFRRKQEEERKRQEYERKYFNSLRAIEQYEKTVNNGKRNNKLNLNELYEDTIQMKYNTNRHLATSIKLECYGEVRNSNTLSVTFKIGKTRMYILSNITSFYEAYKNETTLFYGKQLEFIPKRENFTEDSRELFDFIIRFAEMIEYSKKYNRYGFDKSVEKEIYLTGNEIDNFFLMNKDRNINIKDYYNKNNIYKIEEQKLDINGSLKKEKVTVHKSGYWKDGWYYGESEEESEEYVFRLNIKDYDVLLSNKKMYIFYNNKIFVQDIEENIIKIFNLLGSNDKILVPEDKLEEFMKMVLTNLKKVETENLPVSIAKEGLVVNKLASKILLDTDDNGNILLELKFCYLDKEFNILEKDYKTYIEENNIVRDIPRETEVLKRLFIDGFEPISGRREFVMQNVDDIYEFLQSKVVGYMNDFEVLVTDKFKNKQIKQPKISNIGIRIDNGLLELDLSKINIDMEEIRDVLKDYNIKKKYHKLKNGDLLDLANNEDLDLLDEMTTTLDIDYNKIQKGIVKLPINRSFYLERLMDNTKISVAKNETYTELIDNIENSEISDEIQIDEEFSNKLREYQKVGYRWLKTLEKYKFGGILADDMGLGKTLQIIAVLRSELKSKNKTISIVVCPSTLVLNWKAEVEKWCDDIKVLIIRGNAEERAKQIEKINDYNLVITSYDLLKRDIDNYENKSFKYIIADEAQYIKNASTQNATALKSLNGEIKFALTGTPIENSIAELWSIFDFIMPGYLYNYNKFKKKFEEPIIKQEDSEALNRLKKLIAPFILRRVKKEVLTELPEKNITIMKNEMKEEQEKIYLSYLMQTKKEVAEELKENSFEKSKFKILMLLTRLRQVCCHPSLFIENYKGSSGKLKQCINLVTDAIESGHKILIFSSYTSMFGIIEKELDKLNIEYFKLVGDTPVSKRIEMVDEFNNKPEIKVFLISLKAGGTGLNLTSADVVIHYDPWWNVSSENQATDRAYRIGQKNSVQVYKLITSNSIEEKINKMQERKEKISKDLLSTEETFINKMTKKEILDLFE